MTDDAPIFPKRLTSPDGRTLIKIKTDIYAFDSNKWIEFNRVGLLADFETIDEDLSRNPGPRWEDDFIGYTESCPNLHSFYIKVLIDATFLWILTTLDDIEFISEE